jgi:predicted permease
LVTESVVLSLIGGAAGLLLARATRSLILAALPFPGGQLDLAPDLRVLAFAVIVPFVAAALFGVAPALDATRVDLASALRGDAAGGGGPRSARLRGIIMGAQLAGSLMMLVLAGLFVRALMHARSVDLGYATQNVYAFRPDLARQAYDVVRAAAFYEQFADRVSRLPAVEGTALASHLPLGGHSSGAFHRAESTDTLPPFEQAWSMTVSAEFFPLMEIPILRGRALTQDEVRTSDARPAVISESMAAQFWPGEDALGRRFRIARQRDYIVTGVARDVRNFSIEDRRRPFFYAAARLGASTGADTTSAPPSLSLIVRTNGNAAVVSAVMGVARALDAAVLVESESVEGRLTAITEQTRTAGLFAGVFGVVATLLAIIGVYGGIAYAASQRTREIGVRIALGATRTDIVRLMMSQGSKPVVIGLAAGAVLAAAAAQLTRSLLFGINPLDRVAFLANALLLGGLALLAMYRPARRASRLDPAQTLRLD